jgi:hypothetical protein
LRRQEYAANDMAVSQNNVIIIVERAAVLAARRFENERLHCSAVYLCSRAFSSLENVSRLRDGDLDVFQNTISALPLGGAVISIREYRIRQRS